jgi:hypothetical protein
MLGAGTIEQVDWNDNAWLFLDIGFSANKSSSGLLVGNGEPRTLQFGEASRRIVEPVRCATSPTSLVIEAPLWVCFNRTAIQRVGSLNADLSKERRKRDIGTWDLGAP